MLVQVMQALQPIAFSAVKLHSAVWGLFVLSGSEANAKQSFAVLICRYLDQRQGFCVADAFSFELSNLTAPCTDLSMCYYNSRAIGALCGPQCGVVLVKVDPLELADDGRASRFQRPIFSYPVIKAATAEFSPRGVSALPPKFASEFDAQPISHVFVLTVQAPKFCGVVMLEAQSNGGLVETVVCGQSHKRKATELGNGSEKTAAFLSPTHVSAVQDRTQSKVFISLLDQNRIRAIGSPKSLGVVLSGVGNLARSIGMKKKDKERLDPCLLTEVASWVVNMCSILEEVLTEYYAEGNSTTPNGPQFTFSSATYEALALLRELLDLLVRRLEAAGYDVAAVNVRTLLTDLNEHLHSRLRKAENPMPNLVEVFRIFPSVVFEVLKKTMHTGFHIFSSK